MAMIGYLVYFNVVKSEDFINSPYNTRQDTFSDRVVRGQILSSEERSLPKQMFMTTVLRTGSNPYANIFSQCDRV